MFFFKQKTAYEMRMSDWSSDVCSYDLASGVKGWMVPSLSPALYGALFGTNNPGQRQHVDPGGTGPEQHPAAGRRRRPRGQHIVDQQDPPAPPISPPRRRYPDGARQDAEIGRAHV